MSFWQRLFGKETRESLRPQRLDYLNEGLALERQGDYEAALTSYRLAFRDNPTDSRILLNMAIAFTKTGQPEEAIRHYKRALELDDSLGRRALRGGLPAAQAGRRAAGGGAPAGLPGPAAQGPRRRTLDSPRGERAARHRRQPGPGDAVKQALASGWRCLVSSDAAAWSE